MTIDEIIITKQQVEQITKQLADSGLLIEAGWYSFRHKVVHQDADPIQLREMRLSFFSGAQHLFGSIVALFNNEEEGTKDDANRLNSIYKELELFNSEMKIVYTKLKEEETNGRNMEE